MKKIIVILSIYIFIYSCKEKVTINSSNENNKESIKNMDNYNTKFTFPIENKFTKDFLVQNFWKCNYSSAGENLKYYVILPNYVKPTALNPEKVPNTELINIGRYTTTDKNEPYIEVYVYYQHINEKIQPATWVVNILDKIGNTILDKREITSPNGISYIDILSEKSGIIARTSEYVNGKGDYIMLTAFCEEKDYEKLAEIIQHITTSWKLI